MNNRLYKLMDWPAIEAIIYSEADSPHDLLGPHVAGNSTLLQTFQPGAVAVTVAVKDEKDPYKLATYKMSVSDEEGFFACVIPGKNANFYTLKISYDDGTEKEIFDAYAFRPDFLSEKDLEKFAAGIHYTVYEKLGAHPRTVRTVAGTNFAVWAPGALRVSVVGDFNKWDGRLHQMARHGESGVFEIFIPGVGASELYKFEIKLPGGATYMKADPYAFGQQLRPDTASVVRGVSGFKWDDKEWLSIREARQSNEAPISIYELYLGSFKKKGDEYLNYRELAGEVVSYVKKMRYTHIELMPVMEHYDDATKGYQTSQYYAPTARFGDASDFMYFVNEMHRAGIGVILDWVPAYFPADEHGLGGFDGTCLYEHLDPRQGKHPYNGGLLYNYGRPEVAGFLLANALYWVEKYHIDGIRVIDVTSMLYHDYGKSEGEWVANIYGGHENLEAIDFLKELNQVLKKRNPGIVTIADCESAWPSVTEDVAAGGLGFSFKWNSGWTGDYLRYISFDPYFRAHHHPELTFSMIYAYGERFVLALSHREVTDGKSGLIGRMPGHVKDKFANLRLTYAYRMMHPGRKLLFMGQDIAEFREFSEKREVQWSLLDHSDHGQLNLLVRELNDFYRAHPALFMLDDNPAGFRWSNCIAAERCMIAFIRSSDKEEDTLVVVCNFANIKQDFAIGVALPGKYREVFNTDEKRFGGGGRTNKNVLVTVEEEVDDLPCHFVTGMAPLSLAVFGYEPFSLQEIEEQGKLKEEEIKRRLDEEKQAAAERALAEQKAAEERALAELKALEEKVAASKALTRKHVNEEGPVAELERLFKRERKPRANSEKQKKTGSTSAKSKAGGEKSGKS